MIIRLKVFEQTLSIVDTKSIPRKGSKDYLVLHFLFSSDWKDLDKLCYLQRGEVSQPIDVVDGLVEVPEWFTQQDSFDVTLFGKSGSQEVPTNVVSLRLEKSNTLWEQDAPEPQPSWLAKVIGLSNHPPIPGDNGYWLIWDTDSGAYVESDLPLPSVSGEGATDAVLYTEQSLTEVQQKQARSNIGAGLPPYIVTLELDDDGNLSFPGTYRDMEDIAAIFYSGRRVLTIIDDANRTKRVFVLTAVSRTSNTLFVGQLRFTTAYTSSSGASSVVDEIVVRYSNSSITVIREKSSISLSEIRYFTTNAIIPTKIYQGSFGYWYIGSNHAFGVITENPGKYAIAYVSSLYGNLPLYLGSISDTEIIYRNTAADGSWVGFKIGANSSPQDCGPIAGTLNVQSDWNQNDDTQPDYVKNRPFYTGDPVETEVLVEESTVSFEDVGDGLYIAQFPSTFSATVGETYKVYWDGAAYECTCVDVEGLPEIGNPSIVGAGSDTGEPFLMGVANGEGIQIFTTDASDSHTFSISGTVVPVVKIDPKYLPDNPLNITGATVGQIAKITAVDDTGKPTAWEAVDMPSGGGHWETVLDTVWEQDVIHPTAYDAATGIFTCAEGELNNLELNTEYLFFQQCTKEGAAYNTILGNENLKVTKLSDTTFSIDVTPSTTFVPTNVKFSRGACLAITDIYAKKIRLTLDGQFKPTATPYDKPFYGTDVSYFAWNTGYKQIRNAYQAYQQVTAEVESPYRIVGEILCGFNAPSNNANFHFKNNSFCCPLIPYDVPEGNARTYFLTSDGTKIAKLYSTNSPWHLGGGSEDMAIMNDYLGIISGTKVKLERWVE